MTLTGAVVAAGAVVVGGGSEALYGELGTAFITGGFGLVGLLIVTDSRRKIRERDRTIHRMGKLLKKHRIDFDVDADEDADDE